MTDRLEDELVALLGAEDFIRLAEAHGGERRYIPKSESGTEIAEGLGTTIAAKLARRYGGDALDIPLARRLRARHYRAAGLSNRHIAKRLGISVNGVEKLFRRSPTPRPPRRREVDPRQSDLFS
ncbi:response regulator transcription factor [Jiella endophytica]|uniref:Response regulator transcription factor n=1 Tax=Jiella endophytica TaxID=2558362 RepID=A0A4Y8RE01_9HYPH|nr:response regulator transcription factor [Jiella endophytica]TFF20522.1 response regulator transcription factor [Jiella endophytica]